MFQPGANPALVKKVAKDMSSAPPDVAIGSLRSAVAYDRKVTIALDAMKLSVIAINPSEPPTDSLSLKKYGVKTVLMPGVGHFLMMEKPTEFNALLFRSIDDLLKSCN
jgi:pimeloyl-ACP methyl ester carboxylesterase